MTVFRHRSCLANSGLTLPGINPGPLRETGMGKMMADLQKPGETPKKPGEYNKKIDAKIAEIKSTCGL